MLMRKSIRIWCKARVKLDALLALVCSYCALRFILNLARWYNQSFCHYISKWKIFSVITTSRNTPITDNPSFLSTAVWKSVYFVLNVTKWSCKGQKMQINCFKLRDRSFATLLILTYVAPFYNSVLSLKLCRILSFLFFWKSCRSFSYF